jgi:hypothetical protein
VNDPQAVKTQMHWFEEHVQTFGTDNMYAAAFGGVCAIIDAESLTDKERVLRIKEIVRVAEKISTKQKEG